MENVKMDTCIRRDENFVLWNILYNIHSLPIAATSKFHDKLYNTKNMQKLSSLNFLEAFLIISKFLLILIVFGTSSSISFSMSFICASNGLICAPLDL
uniref:Uncharacterized protein n=1 Tax=Lepeophtheirus salmonis TaxID=72036 RepID=A0A0K2T1R1_LEPSM